MTEVEMISKERANTEMCGSVIRYSCIIQFIITAAIFAVTFRLFYMQIDLPDSFASDTPTHLKFALEGTGYSYLMPILGGVMRIFRPYEKTAVAALEAAVQVCTVFALKRSVLRYSSLSDIQAFFVSAACIFLSSLYVPFLQPLFYKSGIVTQPWHNITYIFMRLFAVVTTAGLLEGIDDYQSQMMLREWFFIAVPLMLATAVKPNFLMGFSWTLLLFLTADVINRRFAVQAVIQCVKMGSTVFPALLLMFLQSRVLYSPGGDSGIEVSLLASGFFSLGVIGTVLKLLRGLALAVLVILYNRRSLKKGEKFIIIQYIISLAVVILFRETGPRALHGNFFWGLYCSGFLLFAFVWTKFIGNFNSDVRERGHTSAQNRCYFLICTMLSLWHLVSGIAYFIIVSMGGKGYGF